MSLLNRRDRALVAIAGGRDDNPKPAAVGRYGQRWTSEPVGTWEVTLTTAGIDVWTDPIVPLTPRQATALAEALAAAGRFGGKR